MPNRRATLQAPIKRLFTEVTKLHGHRQQLLSHLEGSRKRIVQSLTENPNELWGAGGWTTFIISDPTYNPPNNFRVNHPIGTFSARNEEYVAVLDSLVRRINDWTVSRAFELFETFLKDSVAARLCLDPSLAGRDFGTIPISGRRTIRLWRKVARKRRRNQNVFLLKWLSKHTPRLTHWEIHNNRLVNFRSWYAVWNKVRQASTHSDGKIRAVEFWRMTGYQRAIQRRYFPTRVVDGERVLWLEKEATQLCLTLGVEYSFLIYKMQAIELDIEWRSLLPGMRVQSG